MEKNNDIVPRLIVTAGLIVSVTLLEVVGFTKGVKTRLKKIKAYCSNAKPSNDRERHVWF